MEKLHTDIREQKVKFQNVFLDLQNLFHLPLPLAQPPMLLGHQEVL